MDMKAPAEFVVLRHLLTHPHEAPYDISKHTGLGADSASKVLKRLEVEGIFEPEQVLARLRSTSRRPSRRSVHFQAPNPLLWLRQFQGPYLVSGQVAAAEQERVNLAPSSLLVFVPEAQIERAMKAALDIFAKVAPAHQANLHLRMADPWLANDDQNEHVAEKGQRLLDYEEDPMIPLARRLTPTA